MTMTSKRMGWGLALALIAALGLGLTAGCATKAQTGALAGTGVGALIGQTIGRNTAGTLIGTAVGAGLGYVIGNEMDKADAKKRHEAGLPPETAPFGGTKWKVVSFEPKPAKKYESYTLEFSPDGWLTSTETYEGGSQKITREHYRVKGDVLIINNPGYLINAKYTMAGNRAHLNSQEFTAVLEKM